jgi:hypothetical protein
MPEVECFTRKKLIEMLTEAEEKADVVMGIKIDNGIIFVDKKGHHHCIERVEFGYGLTWFIELGYKGEK